MKHETKRFEKQRNEFEELEDASLRKPPKVMSKCRGGLPSRKRRWRKNLYGKDWGEGRVLIP